MSAEDVPLGAGRQQFDLLPRIGRIFRQRRRAPLQYRRMRHCHRSRRAEVHHVRATQRIEQLAPLLGRQRSKGEQFRHCALAVDQRVELRLLGIEVHVLEAIHRVVGEQDHALLHRPQAVAGARVVVSALDALEQDLRRRQLQRHLHRRHLAARVEAI